MVALLLAALLVLMQVVLAAHQVEHSVEPGSEHDCPLCLTGHGLDQGGSPAAVSMVLPARGHPQPVPGLPSAHPRWTAPYQVRAPPPSLVAV
jgi:hypothetical protein